MDQNVGIVVTYLPTYTSYPSKFILQDPVSFLSWSPNAECFHSNIMYHVVFLKMY